MSRGFSVAPATTVRAAAAAVPRYNAPDGQPGLGAAPGVQVKCEVLGSPRAYLGNPPD